MYYRNNYRNEYPRYHNNYDNYYDEWDTPVKYTPKYKSNFNWKPFVLKEDDDTQLYTKDNEGYFTPRAYDLEKKLKYIISDKSSNVIKDLSRMFYHQLVEDPDYMKIDIDETTMTDEELQHYQSVKHIMEESYKRDIPGFSPLDKAIFIFDELSKEGKEDLTSMTEEKIQEGFRRVDEIDRTVYEDKDINEIIDMSSYTKKLNSNLFKKLSLIKHFGAKFKVEKEIKEKPAQSSKLIASKFLTEYEQLALLDKYQYALPQFKINLALKNLGIRTPIEKTDHKQKIIILLDESG